MEEWEREVERTTARQSNAQLRPAVRSLWGGLLAGRVVVMVGDATTMTVCKTVQRVMQSSECPIRDDAMFVWKRKFMQRGPRSGAGALCCIQAGFMPVKNKAPAPQPRIARPISKDTCRQHVESSEVKQLGVAAPWMHVNIGDALQCLHLTHLLVPRDVVVANSGLHHHEMSTLRANMVSFIEYYKAAARLKMNIMWRETIPQHWPTRYGDFAYHLHNYSAPREPYRCAPLPAKRPYGKQKWNVFAEPMLQSAGVPIVRYFNVFAEWHYLHTGGNDCTHYIENATDMRAANVLGFNIRKLLRPGSEVGKFGTATGSRGGLAARSAYDPPSGWDLGFHTNSMPSDGMAAMAAWMQGRAYRRPGMAGGPRGGGGYGGGDAS